MRLQVLHEPALTGDNVAEVCRRRGLSRSSFYDYRRRYEQHGIGGLEPRSRRPATSPRRTPSELEHRICELRRAAGFGARRIRAELRRAGMITAPAVSTIHQVLRRNGLVDDDPHKRPAKAVRRFERDAPNELWQIDATQVELSDGALAWVIDCLDDHSRYLLAALACDRVTGASAWDCLEHAFDVAAPLEVLSDNGVYFTGRRLTGHEVEFERRLKELGINHITTTPSHPQTIGKLERLHRTLKEWLRAQPQPRDIVELQLLLDVFRHHYNDERPHQGIADDTPAQRFTPTARRVPKAHTDNGIIRATRKVYRSGQIQFRGLRFYVGKDLAGCPMDVEQHGRDIRLYLGGELVVEEVLIPGMRYYGPRPRRR